MITIIIHLWIFFFVHRLTQNTWSRTRLWSRRVWPRLLPPPSRSPKCNHSWTRRRPDCNGHSSKRTRTELEGVSNLRPEIEVSWAELEVGEVKCRPHSVRRPSGTRRGSVRTEEQKGEWGGSVSEFRVTIQAQCKAAGSKNPSDSLINWV